MVLTLTIPIRAIYRLEDFITDRHLKNMANVMLGDRPDGRLRVRDGALHGLVQRESVRDLHDGKSHNRPYGPFYWALILCNIVTPQFLWSERSSDAFRPSSSSRWS